MPGFYPIYKLREPSDVNDVSSNDPFDYEVNGFCHLCKLLREKKHLASTSRIPSLKQAYYGKEPAGCF